MKAGLWFVGLNLVAASILAGCTVDNRARVVFDNQSDCGTITASLTNSASGQVNKVDVAVGKQVEVEVTPDTFYNYLVDFPSAGTSPDNTSCPDVESGKVRVPAGAAQTFVLRDATPTPGPSTP